MGARRRCAHARSAWAERRPDHRVQQSGLRAAHRARQRQQADPRARRVLEARRSDHLGVQAAPGRQIPRRRGLHRRRRGVLVSARARADLRLQGLSGQHQGDREGRRPHGADQDQWAEPAGRGQSDLRLHHEQEVGGGAQRHQAAGLQEQGRELRGAQCERHRPVRARLARAGRAHRGQAQRSLLGPQGSAARDHRAGAHHHQAGRNPCRRAALRRSRRGAGRAGAGHRAAEELAEPARHRRPGKPHDLLRLRRRLEGARLIRREGQEPLRRRARAPGGQRARSTGRRSSAS